MTEGRDPHSLGETTNEVLLAAAAVDEEPMTAKAIAAQMNDDVERNTVYYHMKTHLIPGGYVERVGESPKRYQLLEPGQQHVDRLQADGRPDEIARDALAEAQALWREFNDLDEWAHDYLHRLADALVDVSESVEDLDEDTENDIELIKAQAQDLDRRFSDIENLETQVDACKIAIEDRPTDEQLEEAIDDVKENVREDIQEDIDELREEELSELSDAVKSLAGHVERNQEFVERLEGAGLVGRLRWLLFG